MLQSSPGLPSRSSLRFLLGTCSLLALQGLPASLQATSLAEFGVLQWTDKYKGTAFNPASWTQTFVDDFVYDPTLANLKSETGSVGPWFVPGHAPYGVGNFVKLGEAEFPNTYISLTSASFPGGGLRQRAHRANGTSTTWYPAGMATVNTSGQGFTERYGYFEVVGRFPASNAVSPRYNAWCGSWLLTQNGFDSPRTTNRVEIDIIEWYSGDKYSDHQTVHLIDTANVRKTMPNIQAFRPTDLSAGTHAFGVKVTPTWTIFYKDRVENCRFPTVAEFTYPKYLLINNAISNDPSRADTGETEYNFDIDTAGIWQMPQDIILDNSATSGVVITPGSGGWGVSTGTQGYYGPDCLYDKASGKGTKWVTYTPTLPCDGSYKVYARWSAAGDRASNVPYTVVSASGSQTIIEDQRVNGGQWVLLGTFSFNEGTSGSVTISNAGTDAGKNVIADAVRFELQDPWVGSPALPPPAPIGLTATPGDAQVALSWTGLAGGALVDDSSPSVAYTGTWTHAPDLSYYNGSKSYSAQTGATADLAFNGTGIAIYAKKDPGFGKFDVYIDNMSTPVATIDAYSVTPLYQQKVYENLSLTSGSHTIRVQLNGTKNALSSAYTVSLDDFAVTGATGQTTYNVKRATTSGGPYTTLATGLTAPTYTDATATNGTAYYYAVSATNPNGSGANSLEAGATPSAVIRIVDNTDSGSVTLTGAWTTSTSTPGFYGSNYLHDGASGATGGKSVRFTPNLPSSGTYEVAVRWVTGQSRASNAPIDVVHAGVTTTVAVDQQFNNGDWVVLGAFTCNAGTTDSVVIRNDGANSYVIADAVRFKKQ
jgi:hypothetical protein